MGRRMPQFKMTQWNSQPAEFEETGSGKFRINRNVRKVETEDGSSVYEGESAVVTEPGLMAYQGAVQVKTKREQEIYDDTIEELIEEGVL